MTKAGRCDMWVYSLLLVFVLNHHKLVSSIIAFARHCWPLGLFISGMTHLESVCDFLLGTF